MSNNNKLSLPTAHKLCDALRAAEEDLRSKTENMQHLYSCLNESFRDPVYHEYAGEFAACDKSIKDACDLLEELQRALLEYTRRIFETY